MLKVIMGFGAILIAGTVAIGMDFTAAAKGREGYSLGDHIAARVGQVPAAKPAFAALTAVIPGLGQTALQAALPQPPEGWSVRDGKYDDTYLVLGKEPTQMERDMLLELERATTSDVPGFENARSFIQRGDKMVVTDISFFPANTRQIKVVRFYRDLTGAILRRSPPEPVGDLKGLQFVRLTGPDHAGAAFYMATLEDGLYVSLVTNLDPPEAEALLRGFDAEALLAKVADDPTIGEPMIGAEAAEICVRKGGKRTCRPATN